MADVPDASPPDPTRLERKRNKMRAAWIAFAGRILAQLIGAAATVVLGVYVVSTWGAHRTAPSATVTPGAAPPAATTPGALPTLLVLPFRAFSPTSDGDAFSDGLTEALIADLSRIDDLRVISRTSSMAYKGTTKTLPVVAGELAADLVVEGSVVREASRVRVTVQLIDPASDTHVWSGTYDRTSRDILTLQAEVARAMAHELHAAITPRQERQLARAAGLDPAAYDAYVRGRQALHRRSPDDLVEATTQLAQVVARAPTFAPAHAALADAWCLRALDAFGAVAAREALDQAETAAATALRLSPASAEAHLAIAMVRHRRDWKWAEAERAFTRAFELHESHATAHQWYSIFLAEQGRHPEARQHASRAIALDPHAAPVHRTAGLVALYAGRLAEAEAAVRRALALDPTSGVTRLVLASVLLEQERPREAATMADPVRDAALADQRLSVLADAAARAGNRADAARHLVTARALPGPRSLAAEARFAVALDDTRGLLDVARAAVQARTPLACALKVHPVFAAIRQSPDFQELIAQVGM